MIFTDRKITIRNGKSSINEPVILYRGDYEVSIRFTIMESKFRFKNGVNLVDSEKASHGQLAILTPYGGNVFSEIVKCEDGTVTFTLTKEMIDQLEEVGLYSFQIRLFDHYRESRVSIPPVEFGIEVREPVASEDQNNEVGDAIVGYSIARYPISKVTDGLNEAVPDTFDANGQYNKTDWETGDRISEGKLNKIEDAIDKINQNELNDVAILNKKVDSNYNTLNSVKVDKAYVDTQIGAVASGSPKGVYTTVDALTKAKPRGDSNIYVVSSNGCWYYWNNEEWVNGGTYQASLFANYKGQLTTNDNIDNHKNEGVYLVTKANTHGTYPSGASAYLLIENEGHGSFVKQTITNIDANNPKQWFRSWLSNTWSAWVDTSATFKTYKRSLNSEDNIDTLFSEGQYYVSNAATKGTFPVSGTIMCIIDVQGISGFCVQRIVIITSGKEYIRSYYNNKWSAWVDTSATVKTYKRSLNSEDNIDTLFSEGQYWLNTATTRQGTFPEGITMYSILDVTGVGTNWITQTITTTTGDLVRVFVRSYYNKWSAWVELTKTTSFDTLPSIWNGKKANFIGDSITQGGYGNYVNVVKEILGLAIARNYGVGGGRLANTDQDSNYTPVVDRYMEMDDDADIIFMLIGTNDYASQVPIGTNTSNTTTEFKGALNVVLNGLRDKYPDKLIIVATQIHRFNDSALEITMNEYRQATKDICDKQRIICFDLYNATGFDFTKGYYDKILTSDGLHPNQKGAEILGRKIAGFINQM